MFYIKATTGCLGKCTFCSIRRSKGSVESVPLELNLEQFQYGLSTGYREFVLCGEDVGCYGHDLGTSLPELLQRLCAEPGDYLLHIRYIDPQFLIRDFNLLRKVFATGKIVHFCSAIQSGSNRILEIMKKGCRIEDFVACVRDINRNFPWMLLRKHIIVGFPQETEEDFLATCKLFDKVSFNWVTINRYHSYPFNSAAQMEGQIPEDVKLTRARRLNRKFLRQKFAVSQRMLSGVPQPQRSLIRK